MRTLAKIIAVILSVIVILISPGPYCYQALALPETTGADSVLGKSGADLATVILPTDMPISAAAGSSQEEDFMAQQDIEASRAVQGTALEETPGNLLRTTAVQETLESAQNDSTDLHEKSQPAQVRPFNRKIAHYWTKVGKTISSLLKSNGSQFFDGWQLAPAGADPSFLNNTANQNGQERFLRPHFLNASLQESGTSSYKSQPEFVIEIVKQSISATPPHGFLENTPDKLGNRFISLNNIHAKNNLDTETADRLTKMVHIFITYTHFQPQANTFEIMKIVRETETVGYLIADDMVDGSGNLRIFFSPEGKIIAINLWTDRLKASQPKTNTLTSIKLGFWLATTSTIFELITNHIFETNYSLWRVTGYILIGQVVYTISKLLLHPGRSTPAQTEEKQETIDPYFSNDVKTYNRDVAGEILESLYSDRNSWQGKSVEIIRNELQDALSLKREEVKNQSTYPNQQVTDETLVFLDALSKYIDQLAESSSQNSEEYRKKLLRLSNEIKTQASNPAHQGRIKL